VLPPIGLYLEAVLDAKKIEQNIVIPRDVLRLGDVILLVDADDKLRKQKVEVIYSDKSSIDNENVKFNGKANTVV